MQDSKSTIDTAKEADYWRDNFRNRPYVDPSATYDDYGPAYSYGVDTYGRRNGRSFDEAEADLSRNWGRFKGKSKLTWERAKHAVKDAWNRMTD